MLQQYLKKKLKNNVYDMVMLQGNAEQSFWLQDSVIMALHISNDDEFEEKLESKGFAKMLSEKTGYNKISVKIITDEDGKDAVESLVNEAENAKAILIVVLKEKRNFFERLFKSSFTAEPVENIKLPIMVFHKAN